MRCHPNPAWDCIGDPDLCGISGCQRLAPKTALVRERPQIPLDYKPGRVMRGIMALTDRGTAAVKRGPTPFAPALPSPEPPAMSATVPPAPEPQPAPTLAPPEVRILELPGPAWVVYLGDRPLGMTMRIERPR